MRKLGLMLLAIFALSIPLAACGEDEETAGGGEADAQTKEQYIAEATEVCARINEDLEPAFEQRDPDQAVTIMREGVADLQAIPAPEGDEEQLDEVYAAAEKAVDDFEADPGSGDPFGEFTKLAQQYGIPGGCTGTEQGDVEQAG